MYIPKRDSRFEYVHEALFFIENNQCETCVFRQLDDEEMPMCLEISGKFFLEEPIVEVDDLGSDGIVCTKYRDEELASQERDQSTLF